MNKQTTIDQKRITRAAIYCVLAALSYSLMTLLVKLVAKDTNECMIVFIRFFVSLFWITMVLSYKKAQGKNFSIKTQHLGTHIIRAGCSFISMFALFYALKYVPLADVNSLALTYTLFIPILTFIFFRTKTSTKNWLVLAVGFIGVVIILKPFSGTFNPVTLVALISGITTAGSLVGVYEIAKDEQPYTILLYYFPITFAISIIFAIFNWQTPDPHTLLILLISGIAGTAYQYLITNALAYAPPRLVSPLLYFNIFFSGIFDWIFWHHLPDWYFWLGTTLVAIGCYFSVKFTNQSNDNVY